MKQLESVFLRLAPYLMAMAAVFLVVFFVKLTEQRSTENNAYLRVINCVIARKPNATNRTQQDVNECFTTVENETGLKLERYNK